MIKRFTHAPLKGIGYPGLKKREITYLHGEPALYPYLAGKCDWCGNNATLDDPEDGTLFTAFVKLLGWVGLELGTIGVQSDLRHFCCEKCRNAFTKGSSYPIYDGFGNPVDILEGWK